LGFYSSGCTDKHFTKNPLWGIEEDEMTIYLDGLSIGIILLCVPWLPLPIFYVLCLLHDFYVWAIKEEER